nr:MAG TPA: hypothetical protein [Caudoviricetes sp.]
MQYYLTSISFTPGYTNYYVPTTTYFSVYPPWNPTATHSRGMLSQPGNKSCNTKQLLCFFL